MTAEKLALLRKADTIYLDEIRAAGLYDAIWQAFVVPRPRLRIISPDAQGDGKPLALFPVGAEITVRVECDAALTVGSLTLHDRAARVAEAPVANHRAEFRVTGLTPGFHTVFARAELPGGHGELSRPVSVLVRTAGRQ